MIIFCPIITLIGIYLAARCGYTLTTVQEGSLWGMAFPMSQKQQTWRKKNILLLIVGIILVLVCIGPGLGALLVGLFSGFLGLIFALACLAGLPAAFILGTKHAVKESKGIVLRELNTDALGQLPLIQEVEAQLDQAQTFIVTYTGIGLADKANYCYASFMYGEHRLGALSTPAEMALLATYFCQKYENQFVGEPSWDRTFYPGQTVTYLGPGGVFVDKTPSAMTSKLNCYIFTRVK